MGPRLLTGAVDLEPALPGRPRLRCLLRGHRDRAGVLGGVLLVVCHGCGRMLAAELPAAAPAAPPERSPDALAAALDLAASVLGAGPQEELEAAVETLTLASRDGVLALAAVLLVVADDRALAGVRTLAVTHMLRQLRGART